MSLDRVCEMDERSRGLNSNGDAALSLFNQVMPGPSGANDRLNDPYRFHQGPETRLRQTGGDAHPTDIIDRDNITHTRLAWGRADLNNPNSAMQITFFQDWRAFGPWKRQRDAAGKLTNDWRGSNGHTWRFDISLRPNGELYQVEQSADGKSIGSRTYNPRTGIRIYQDANDQVTQALFPNSQCWEFERNGQGMLTAKLNDQVMAGNYQFTPQGFSRTQNGNIEQWNYDGTRTSGAVDAQGNRRIDFPGNDPEGRMSNTTQVNGDVVTRFRDGRTEHVYQNRSGGLKSETTFPANDPEHRTRTQVYNNGTEKIEYQGRSDHLSSETRYPSSDPEKRRRTSNYDNGNIVTEFSGRQLMLQQNYPASNPEHRRQMSQYVDGRKEIEYDNGRLDGLQREINYAPNDEQKRSHSLIYADGRVVTEMQNHSTQTRNPDGSVKLEYSDPAFGRVIYTNYPASSEIEYIKQFNGQTITVRRNGEATWEGDGQTTRGRVVIGENGSPYFHTTAQAGSSELEARPTQGLENSCQNGSCGQRGGSGYEQPQRFLSGRPGLFFFRRR